MATFIFEGAIAVGKSSLIKNVETILKSEFDLETDLYLEPVSQWTKTRGGNLLCSLGDSMKKYGFITQAMVMSSLKLQRREISENRKSLNLLEIYFWQIFFQLRIWDHYADVSCCCCLKIFMSKQMRFDFEKDYIFYVNLKDSLKKSPWFCQERKKGFACHFVLMS